MTGLGLSAVLRSWRRERRAARHVLQLEAVRPARRGTASMDLKKITHRLNQAGVDVSEVARQLGLP